MLFRSVSQSRYGRRKQSLLNYEREITEQKIPRGKICEAFQLSRAILYKKQKVHRIALNNIRPNSLSVEEKAKVLDILHSERFVDKSPAEVFATLLDEEIYLCSVSSMYRILRANNEVKERRQAVRRAGYKKPELLATTPNQVWSWDITKLRSPAKWVYFYLYVVIDILSRGSGVVS